MKGHNVNFIGVFILSFYILIFLTFLYEHATLFIPFVDLFINFPEATQLFTLFVVSKTFNPRKEKEKPTLTVDIPYK